MNILNDIEENNINPIYYLKTLLNKSIFEKNRQIINLINPIQSESEFTIDDILDCLNKHFYYSYKSRGVSILPVIALYSIYEILIDELNRFDKKYLSTLESHTSSDKSSGESGDIIIKNEKDDEAYEVIEVKFEIPITYMVVKDCFKKIKSTNIQRYYILSTENILEKDKIDSLIKEIREQHGCQIIVNGIFSTLKYYLRLIENTDKFIEKYIQNLNNHSEINYEHKLSWNKIMSD